MVASQRDERTERSLARTYIAGFRASIHGCVGLRRAYGRWQILWEDWSRAGRRRGDPYRCRVDDDAAARRCRWRWDQSWCRRRAWGWSLRAWLRAREPLLQQVVFIGRPLRALPRPPRRTTRLRRTTRPHGGVGAPIPITTTLVERRSRTAAGSLAIATLDGPLPSCFRSNGERLLWLD